MQAQKVLKHNSYQILLTKEFNPQMFWYPQSVSQ